MKRGSASYPHEGRGILRRSWSALVRTLNAIAEGVNNANRMRRMYDELSAMSDVELQDMGMTRSDIGAVVTRTYRLRQSAASNVFSFDRRDRPHSSGHVTQPGGRRSKQMSESGPKVVDVRSLVPAQRHAKIFQLVNDLGPGTSFILVNDHDPKPLYYQLEAEYPKQFSWTYLQQGPETWQVQIGKLAKAA
jgi:uncharacterized protein (DUF2249 family)/uncharacterized protein YjiS (DUF1127 family)